MQEDLEKLHEVNVEVVGISYDSVDVLAQFAGQSDVSFPLLSDPDAEVIEAYGLLNDTGRAKIAHPATILIGQDGNVKATLSVDGYRARHSNDQLIEAAKELD